MLSSTSATTRENTPPKRRKYLTTAQSNKLVATFNKNDGYIDVATKDDLARELDVDGAWIRVWFCNRRGKAKRKKNKMLFSTTATTRENIRPKRQGILQDDMLSSTTTTTIENIRPKRRKTRFTMAQQSKMEAIFNKNDGFIDRADKDALAQEFDMDEAPIRVWFQSRRTKVRRQIKPTTSEIRDVVAQSVAMETTEAKQSTGNRTLFDPSNLPPQQSVINTGRCFELRKELQNQQSGLPSHPCYKQSHTTEIRKPEANQISVEALYTGIAYQQVSSPLMVYNVQTFSPMAVLRVLPVKENPREHCDGSHVKKTGTPHLQHETPSTNFRRILPKPVVSPFSSERQGQGQPQDGDGCSNLPSSTEQIRSLSGNSGMCPPHVPMSTQLPSKSVVDRGQETVVPDKDTLVHEGLPGEITFEPKEHDSSLTNYSRQEVSSVDTDEAKEHDSSLTNYSRQEVSSVDTDEAKEHDSSLTNYSRQEVSSVDTDEAKEHDSSLTNYSRQEVSSVDTDEAKEHDSSLTNYSRLDVSSVDTDEAKEHDSSLTNYSRQEMSSVDTDDPKEHDSRLTNYPRQEVSNCPALHKVSFFSAMCEIDMDWNPLPDDVAVMFNSYRESPDCSVGVDITDSRI